MNIPKAPIVVPQYELDPLTPKSVIDKWGFMGYAGEDYCKKVMLECGAGVMEVAAKRIEADVKRKRKEKKVGWA